jgi:hypothetical protein
MASESADLNPIQVSLARFWSESYLGAGILSESYTGKPYVHVKHIYKSCIKMVNV